MNNNKIIAFLSNLKGLIYKKLDVFKKVIAQNYEDLLVYFGLFFIIFASFLVNRILGFYILGSILLGFGAFLIKYPKTKRGGE